MTHHLVQRRLVIPIPDLWLVAIAYLTRKAITLSLKKGNHRAKWSLIILCSTVVACDLFAMRLYNVFHVLTI